MGRQVQKEQWKRLKSGIRQRWSKISHDELNKAEGDGDQIVGLLEKKYGYTKKEAEKELESFIIEEEERRKMQKDLIKDKENVYD